MVDNEELDQVSKRTKLSSKEIAAAEALFLAQDEDDAFDGEEDNNVSANECIETLSSFDLNKNLTEWTDAVAGDERSSMAVFMPHNVTWSFWTHFHGDKGTLVTPWKFETFYSFYTKCRRYNADVK